MSSREARPDGEPGRILGIDPGERRIGVAVSDPGGIIASPHSVIDRRAGDTATRLRTLCDELAVGMIVVGLPVSLDGNEGPAAEKARAFGAWVSDVTGCEVVYQDERFSTVVAEQAMLEGGTRRRVRRDNRDRVAAAVVLQSFLDGRR